jgi:S1-C subfamily serine protease
MQPLRSEPSVQGACGQATGDPSPGGEPLTDPVEPPAATERRTTLRRTAADPRLRRMVPFVGGIAAALIGVGLYGALFPPAPPLSTREVDQAIESALASQTPGPALSRAAYARILPSFVVIQAKGDPAVADDDDLGSGVIIDDRGDILTALHVVANASEILVSFTDGTVAAAEIVAQQPEKDIAVLQAAVQGTTFTPAILGNPGALQIGDEAFVVGSPFGLAGSMSSGVISGLERTFTVPETKQTIDGLIQIDAAVNPGNSGGPLLDRNGRVVGIVTALINPTDERVFVGVGLAVPIDVAGGAADLPPY